MKALVVATCIFLSFVCNAHAGIINCPKAKIENLYVQADRDDNHVHSNKLLIKLLGSQCNERQYVYLETSHPSFDAILSVSLAAKVADREIIYIVNPSRTIDDATQIAIAYLGK